MEEEIGRLGKVLSMIKGIERKNLEFENYISNLNIYSRTDLLKEISFNIIKNSKLFQGLNVDFRDVQVVKDKKEEILTNNFIEATILKIRNNPMKKIIFLREFLDNLKDISQNDKDVILQSLKDKEDEELNQELSNLVQIFKKHD
ncbi:MAG: hypothetical protein EU529_03360 [Promethearchaeota archaeon]|nr:MAG: hypothetical protein EU529_03360 [Candidatus Lokiarchaeota archaeon]